MSVHKLFPQIPDAVLEPEYSNQHNDSAENLAAAQKLHKQHGIRSVYANLLKSLPAALILQQLVYWHCPDKYGKSKLRVRYKGILWLAKSRQELMDETGVTIRQYRSAIPALEKLGIIDYRIGGFAGKPTPFFQLNLPRLVRLVTPIEAVCLKPLGQNVPNVWVKTSQTNTGILTGTTTENTLLTPEPTPQVNIGNTSEGEDMFKKNKDSGKPMKGPTTVKTVLSATAKDKKDIDSCSMYEVWATTVPAHNPSVKFVGPFSQMQKGMMNTLSKSWGSDAKLVLAFVLSNWIKFCKLASASAGTKSYPDVPNATYLTKHRDVAMNFYLNKAVSKDAELVSQPVQLIAPVKINVAKAQPPAPKAETITPPPVKTEEEDDQPMSLEELLAFKPINQYNKP